jgi:hypothetical protein
MPIERGKEKRKKKRKKKRKWVGKRIKSANVMENG